MIHASLWDVNAAVRVAAAMALLKIDPNKSPLVIPALIKALNGNVELVCWFAADALG